MTENWQKISFILIIVLLAGAFMYRYFSPHGKCEREARRMTTAAHTTVTKYGSDKSLEELFKTAIDNEIERCLTENEQN